MSSPHPSKLFPSLCVVLVDMNSNAWLLQCRYVVRAKAGKKQSSKDAGTQGIHSAGASLRRYNEFALKKVRGS